MALISNTVTKYAVNGQREDLSDIIYNISPTDTPFMSSIGKSKATAVNHEWEIDALAAPAANNYHLEGDEIAFDAQTTTTRIGNKSQISRKAVIVSGTMESVDLAGRNNELAYLISKASKELKRDMETTLTANQAPVDSGAGAARRMATLESWIKTNSDKGGGAGADRAAVRGPRAAGRSAGAWQDHAGRYAVHGDGPQVQPHPVHAGPDAGRYSGIGGARHRRRWHPRLPLHRGAGVLPAADGG